MTLSPYQGHSSSSPPPGRNRLSSKRNLSPDTEKEVIRSTRQRTENLPASSETLSPIDQTNSNEIVTLVSAPTDMTQDAVQAAGEKILDLSLVLPSPKITNDLN